MALGTNQLSRLLSKSLGPGGHVLKENSPQTAQVQIHTFRVWGFGCRVGPYTKLI